MTETHTPAGEGHEAGGVTSAETASEAAFDRAAGRAPATVSADGTPPGFRGPEAGEVGPLQSGWRLTVRSFAENRLAVAGLGILLFFIVFCFFGPIVYRTNQTFVELLSSYLSPGARHILGTDPNGIDELGELMRGGQASLEVGACTALIASVIGTFYGTIAGLVGGVIDATMMRLVDVILSIPFLFIVLIVATQVNPTVISMSLVLGLFSWQAPSRLVRGEVLSLRTRDFIAAARVMGASKWRLSVRHLIPNALGVVIVNITFQVADAIIAVATIGFLGFGLQFPQEDWGDMLSNGVTYALDGYWWLIYPAGICLVLVVMACNFVGDATRDALEVRLQRR